MFDLPASPWLLALYVLGWLAFSFAFVSFCEHQIHKHLMHKKRLPKWVYRASHYLLDVFEAHAVRHHATWYKEFDHEPHPQGRQENLDIKWTETVVILSSLLPMFVFLFWKFPLGGTILVGMTVLHNRLWNALHRQMHIPQETVFKNWKIFHFLARHHFMHHQQMAKNFNIVFPLADYVLRSKAKPRRRDMREMLRLGYLKPRSAATAVRVQRWRAEVAERRGEHLLAHAH